MYISGPLIVVYLLLYGWTVACSALGVWLGLHGAHFAQWSAGLCAGFAALFGAVFLARLPLMDVFSGLNPRERFGVFLVCVAFFFMPRIFMLRPPWILSLVALNPMLVFMALKPHGWHRLLFNNNLILLAALAAYPMPEEMVWGILGFAGVLWVVTAIVDHFASTLETIRQGSGGMGGMILGLAFRQTFLAAALAAPLVVATLLWGPEAHSLPGAPSLPGVRQYYEHPGRGPEWTLWEAVKQAFVMGTLLTALFYSLKYLQRLRARHAAGAVPMEYEPATRGVEVAAAPEARRPPPAPLDAPREAIIAAYESFCTGMGILDRRRPAWQTAREYNATLSDLAARPGVLTRLSRVFENARYGLAPIGERDIQEFVEDIEALRLSAARSYAEKQAAKRQEPPGS